MSGADVRSATRDEVAKFIWRVWKTVYSEGAYPSVLRSDGDEHFVAEESGAVIGFAGITIDNPTLETLYLLAEHCG
jgi:hypothetical protein